MNYSLNDFKLLSDILNESCIISNKEIMDNLNGILLRINYPTLQKKYISNYYNTTTNDIYFNHSSNILYEQNNVTTIDLNNDNIDHFNVTFDQEFVKVDRLNNNSDITTTNCKKEVDENPSLKNKEMTSLKNNEFKDENVLHDIIMSKIDQLKPMTQLTLKVYFLKQLLYVYKIYLKLIDNISYW